MKYWIVLLGLILAVSFDANAQSDGLNFECITNPPDFLNMSYLEANRAVYAEEKKSKCPQYAVNLIAQLRDRRLSDDNKCLLIYLLGEMRPADTNSVEVLLDYIDFKATQIDPLIHPVRWGTYPAKEALWKIGTPVIIPVMNRLPNESHDVRRRLMCEVLKNVEGRDAAMSHVEQDIASETDPAGKTNLELTLAELQK